MTQCTNENMADYDYGLVCEDDKGNENRHSFGKNSFNKEEVFDTLIVCKQCSGIGEEVKLQGSLAMNVKALADDVKELKGTLGTVTKAVSKLKGKVFGTTNAAAPAAAPAAASSLLHHHRQLRGTTEAHRARPPSGGRGLLAGVDPPTVSP